MADAAPIARIPVLKGDGLTWDAASRLFSQLQVVHVRYGEQGGSSVSARTAWPGYKDLCDLNTRIPDVVASSWTSENCSAMAVAADKAKSKEETKQADNDSVSPDHALSERTEGSWYASFLLQGQDEDSTAAREDFLRKCPMSEPPFLRGSGAAHTSPVWMFFGQHASRQGGSIDSPEKHKRRKVTTAKTVDPLPGRKEHTDSVSHSGTWHFQLSGRKTWKLRPLVDAPDWKGHPPKIAENSDTCDSPDGIPRLTVECEAGDVLLVNTRLWWHQTWLPCTDTAADGLSFSYARDIFLPEADTPDAIAKAQAAAESASAEFSNQDGVYAGRNIEAGGIVLFEHEMPDCALPVSDDPNCVVAEVEIEPPSSTCDKASCSSACDNSGCCASNQATTQFALVALKDISAGDWLTVAASDSEADSDSDAEADDEQ